MCYNINILSRSTANKNSTSLVNIVALFNDMLKTSWGYTMWEQIKAYKKVILMTILITFVIGMLGEIFIPYENAGLDIDKTLADIVMLNLIKWVGIYITALSFYIVNWKMDDVNEDLAYSHDHEGITYREDIIRAIIVWIIFLVLFFFVSVIAHFWYASFRLANATGNVIWVVYSLTIIMVAKLQFKHMEEKIWTPFN